jgi:FMN reductase
VSVRVGVLVGNPQAHSRTLAAATYVARELVASEPDLVVDLATVGAAVLDGADTTVDALVADLAGVDVLVVGSPTYKAAYTGLLKGFLDRFPTDGLAGVVAIPLMLGAGARHALVVETSLRPVLTELGATVPVRGLYVVESEHDSTEAYRTWLATARPLVTAMSAARAGV